MALFKKFCHLKSCRQPFESDARNSKYHSEACREAAKKQSHGRQKRKRAYQDDIVNRRASSMSRAQARDAIINDKAVGVCERCGHFFKVGKLECHHRNGDPFDNSKENLALVCETCHPKCDAEWRQAKAEGVSIPDMRNHALVLSADQDAAGIVVATWLQRNRLQ